MTGENLRRFKDDRVPIDMNRVFKISEVPWAQKLKGFIIYQTLNTFYHELRQSVMLNGRTLTFSRDPYVILIYILKIIYLFII